MGNFQGICTEAVNFSISVAVSGKPATRQIWSQYMLGWLGQFPWLSKGENIFSLLTSSINSGWIFCRLENLCRHTLKKTSKYQRCQKLRSWLMFRLSKAIFLLLTPNESVSEHRSQTCARNFTTGLIILMYLVYFTDVVIVALPFCIICYIFRSIPLSQPNKAAIPKKFFQFKRNR